ncbi:hypothetical protein BGW37DRAFT_241397 [Umbelopsis sp. PMI_123]|jgi:hypothetical protein|nr:hypothetical protein BGW37DRAFT_241397 [Umbelopsis sp. PMI_123]
MEYAIGGATQLVNQILEKGPHLGHTVKRQMQAKMWADWPEHIRAESRDWIKDIISSVLHSRIGDVVPGKLYNIDRTHSLRKQGCALALTAHAGESAEQYLNCVIVLLSILSQNERHGSLDMVRRQLEGGYSHVDRYFSDKKPAEQFQGRREYAIWLDALCQEILQAAGLLHLDRYNLDIEPTEVTNCLMGLLSGDIVRTETTIVLIDTFNLRSIIERGYTYKQSKFQ